MSRNLHTEEMDRLFDGILTLKTREEAYRFFEDLCTAGELEAMQQRFEVASMLRNKNTYSEIAEKTGASTATISRVNRSLMYGDDGYELVIRRLEEN
ncbi:MAG: TrpR YerC/YecD [Lachnospiraceae bacterium]|uniref:TrpR YerC/YecD n=1 Tax=Candidatus Weimeria bifida TaxID=2599074 RepID=A0A6N7IZQ4_9FIRM|nr:TrpR YerC/YecD [Candidatus Weimeria bifida]RRF96505.1 MAG: TrpR YerC/YecD [Lachnospiraceae bacterium]